MNKNYHFFQAIRFIRVLNFSSSLKISKVILEIYRLLNFTTILKKQSQMPGATYIDIANLRRVFKTAHYRSTWGEVTRIRAHCVRCFLMLKASFEKRDCHQRTVRPGTPLLSSFQLSSSFVSMCTLIPASKHKRRLNLRTAISRPAKRRARSIAIFNRATLICRHVFLTYVRTAASAAYEFRI